MTPLPSFDPLGLPVPSALLQALSYLTLTLHFLAMQFTVGGALVMLWAWRREPGIARFFGTGLPLGFSYLVTFGVPPLLFIQVTYGQFFYSSSVLIGAFWISVVPLIILGYGAAYWHRLSRDGRPRHQLYLIATIAAAVLCVGFIYVNNLTLSMTPERWLAHYQAHPAGGALNASEPTLWPRYGFFITPALFVAGLALLIRGGYLATRRPAAAATSRRVGLRLALAASLLQAVFSVAFWISLPSPIAARLTQPGLYGALAAGGSLLGLVALGLGWLSTRRAGIGLAVLAAHVYAVGDACVIVLRDLIRQLYLAPYLDLSTVAVHAQWGMFFAFLATFTAGAVFLAVLTKRVIGDMVAADPPLPSLAGR